MDANQAQTQQNDSCGHSSGSGGECCSSGSAGWKSWKTAVFVIVILAAGAVAAHSLLTNGTGAAPCASSGGLCPFSKACAPNKACALNKPCPNDVACPSQKKADNPSSCCPKSPVPGCCPKATVPGCCPSTAVPSCCPKAASN